MTPAGRWLLPLILLLAAAVRIWGIGFGLPLASARPDETQIAGPAVGFLSGDLEPPFFQWPTLFAYLVACTYAFYVFVTRPFGGYQTLAAFAESRRQSLAPFLYLSRSLSMLFGVATVGLVYVVARRLFDRTIGLVSALFLAVCFLHVRDSHFGVTDVPMTAFVVLGVLLILQWHGSRRLRDAAIAGLAAGIAGSIKYNGLGLAIPYGVAWLIAANEERKGNGPNRAAVIGALPLFTVGLVAGFFGGSPYIAIDWARFLADVETLRNTSQAGHGLIVGRGWSYYAATVLPAAIGWPMLVLAATGIAALLVVRVKEAAVLFAFPIAYYIVAGSSYAVFSRYMIPVVPFLCIAAAWSLVEGARWCSRGWSRPWRVALITTGSLAVAAPTAWNSFLLDRLLATPDNRLITARALADMLPAGSLFYQSGEGYGHIPMAVDGRELPVQTTRYDAAAGQFIPRDPDWILVQRSPLVVYSAVPRQVEQLVAERYLLKATFGTESRRRTDRVYDQQDAFYLPLTGLRGLERPGPAFELYQRRANPLPPTAR